MSRGRSDHARVGSPRIPGARVSVEVLDPSPVAYDDLPMAGDEDLERQLDARYGAGLHTYFFRRVRIPLPLIEQHLLEIPEIADEDDGPRRRRIAEDYRDRFAAGQPPDPIVVVEEGGDWVIGFHRGAGARAAGLRQLEAFELLPE